MAERNSSYQPNLLYQSLLDANQQNQQRQNDFGLSEPPALPARNTTPTASAPPPLPPRGAPSPAPQTAPSAPTTTNYPSAAFMSPTPMQEHQTSPQMASNNLLPVGPAPTPTFAVYPSAANAAPQQPPMMSSPPQQPIYTQPTYSQPPPLAPRPQQYPQAQPPPQAMYSSPPMQQQQPVYTTQTQPYVQTTPGPILMTQPPMAAPSNSSLFVPSGQSATATTQTQGPKIEGPTVCVHIVGVQFAKPEWAPWTRVRVGTDQSGWSNYGQTRVKSQKEAQSIEWNESFYLPVRSIAQDRIQIEVINKPTQFQLDYSVIGSNDVLVEKLPNGQPQHLVMPLVDRRGVTRGHLTIIVTGYNLVRPTLIQATADPLRTLFRTIFK